MLPVMDCRMVNCCGKSSGVEEFGGLVACSPDAEARTRAIAKRMRVESSRFWFIVFGDFPGDAVKLNNQNTLSDENRNSPAFQKASSKPDVLAKFRLGSSEAGANSM